MKSSDTSAQAKANAKVEAAVEKKKRAQRPFPACSFEEAMSFAKAIYEFGSGQPVRRLTIFDHLQKSPESGPSRQLITNANKYGLLEGSYQADQLRLTDDGLTAIEEEGSEREKTKARVKLAIEAIDPFKKLYDRFAGNKLPAKSALIDTLKDFEVQPEFADEAADTFIVNLRFIGLLQTLSGAERIVTLDHLLDSLPSSQTAPLFRPSSSIITEKMSGALVTATQAAFDTTCFYVTPIGEENSEQRKHSDLFLGSIVEPALEQFGLKVIRADQIDKPGTITRQIIDYLLKSRLVIADLSFHNPNVFYELAIRHASRLPVVQLIRSSERVPFDLNQIRTIKIDTSDIYSLVPRIELYRSEIASQVRRALDDPDSVDNPITNFYPGFSVKFE